MKLNDPLCSACQNKKTCPKLCMPMQWINGNTPAKERLYHDNIDKYEHQNYNIVLAELIEDRATRLTRITNISDKRLRSIAAMLAVEIPRKTIAALLNMSYRQLLRILNYHK